MGRKILLVEDDAETAAYLAKGLTQEGHSVEQAGNGQGGLFRATDGSESARLDLHYQLGASRDRARHVLMGELPLSLHPAPKRALFSSDWG